MSSLATKEITLKSPIVIDGETVQAVNLTSFVFFLLTARALVTAKN